MGIANSAEAKRMIRQYDPNSSDKSETVLYTKALEYLIRETGDAGYIAKLGSFCYENGQYSPALKHFEAAAEKGSRKALVGLGCIWYYGKTGERDYEKAFRYFTLASDKGDLNAEVKLADMYKNGFFVRKDYGKYKDMIRSLYHKVRSETDPALPLPEVFLRYSKLCAERGETIRALRLLQDARSLLEQRMKNAPFYGTLSQIRQMISELYSMTDFDVENFEFYDLFYIFRKTVKIQFLYNGSAHVVETLPGNCGNAVRFDGVQFDSDDEFFFRATADGKRLTAVYDELYGFEITKLLC